jgi:L-fuconolactonase
VIIDSHVHAIAKDSNRYPVISRPGDDPDSWYRTVPADAETLLASMQLAGVGRTILVQPLQVYGGDNGYLVENCTAYPDRFSGVGSVGLDDHDPRATMRRLITGQGLAGIRLNLTVLDGVVDPGFLPLLDCADELRIPLLLRATAELLPAVAGLLKRYPSLPMVVDHCGFLPFGDGPPWAAAAPLFGLGAYDNLYVKVSTMNLDAVGEAADPAVLVRDLATCFGMDHLVWGSDFPHTHDGGYARLLDKGRASARLLPDSGADFLGGTAARLWPARGGAASATD